MGNKTQDILSVDGLLKYKKAIWIEYAGHYGGKHTKCIEFDCDGNYRVLLNKEIILTTSDANSAISQYNII